jgi:hypothetical protein
MEQKAFGKKLRGLNVRQVVCVVSTTLRSFFQNLFFPFLISAMSSASAASPSASAASSSAAAFPSSGSWTLYFHDPEDTNWSPASYKKIGTLKSFSDLWGSLSAIDPERFRAGMYFLMRDPYLPLWEHRSNIDGGSYCIKVPELQSQETFQRYAAAAILDLASTDKANTIVGVSISPKKGFHIIKIWNSSAKKFHSPTADLAVLADGMRLSDVLYRPNTDQRF